MTNQRTKPGIGAATLVKMGAALLAFYMMGAVVVGCVLDAAMGGP